MKQDGEHMYNNNTRLSTAEDCLRKYFWISEFLGNGIEPKYRDDALDFGQIYHTGLASLYSKGDINLAISDMLEDRDRLLDLRNLDFDTKNKWLELSEWQARLLTAYDEWRQEEDDFAVLQSEAEGAVVLGEICYRCGSPYASTNPRETSTHCVKCQSEVHALVFRIDQLVNQGGAIKVVDHKTAKSAGDNYIASWENSMQMIGYTYGARAIFGPEVQGYIINITKKLKTVGLPEQTTKQCPECHNGKRKRLTCGVCNQTGRVAREGTSPEPFIRLCYSYSDAKEDLFLRSRLRITEDIQREQKRFEHEPDVAWPMNCKSCYTMKKCPFIRLCYDGEPSTWYDPHPALLYLDDEEEQSGYKRKKKDYVTLAREEMQ
jgi:hypothetical protein